MVREIIVRWDVPGAASEVLNIFHAAESGGSLDEQQEAIQDFLEGVSPFLATSVSWSIDQTVRVMETQTGQTTGFETASTPLTGTGDGTGPQAVANATSVLFRWKSTTIKNGRLVQGRTFIPGLDRANMTDGQLSPANVAAFNGPAAALVAADVAIGVWSRPVNGGGGPLAAYVSGSAWNELATQRRRRG